MLLLIYNTLQRSILHTISYNEVHVLLLLRSVDLIRVELLHCMSIFYDHILSFGYP